MVTCPNRLGGSVIDLICVSGEMWADWGELKVAGGRGGELIDGKIVSWEREGRKCVKKLARLAVHNEAAERGVGLQKAKKQKY